MFSPAIHEGGPAKGTRSNRRRQRPLNSDSLEQPKAKRQRVPLTETTFVNPDGPPEMYEVKSDKVNRSGMKRDGIENFTAATRKELSVRSKKPKAGERVSKGDGSTVLVRCLHHTGRMRCDLLALTGNLDYQYRLHRQQTASLAG